MTVNHFALRHYWWIEVYTCSKHSESVQQYSRIVWVLLYLLLKLLRMTAYPTVFPQRSNLLCLAQKINKVIFNSCLNLCNFLNLFCFWLLLFHVSCFMIVLQLEINDVFLRFFLLFNSITSAVTACNMGVFKKTSANTWILFLHHRNQFQTSIKFSLKFRS